jgi:hypothetical protein
VSLRVEFGRQTFASFGAVPPTIQSINAQDFGVIDGVLDRALDFYLGFAIVVSHLPSNEGGPQPPPPP